MRQEQFPVMLNKNNHEQLKMLAKEAGLQMNTIVHKLIKSVSEKTNHSNEIKESHLPRFFLCELIHLKDIGIISENEFETLAFNKDAEGIVMDIIWTDDLFQKREVLKRYEFSQGKIKSKVG
jgi:hypothetical protein